MIDDVFMHKMQGFLCLLAINIAFNKARYYVSL